MPNPTTRKILLIGWDAADWQHIHPLLDRGLMPTLAKLVEGGTIGNLATLQPVLSPMLWNSIATGKHAYKHGIAGFIEPNPSGEGARPFSSTSRKTRALWNIFTLAGKKTNVVNWWASHPAEKVNGCVVSNLFAGVKIDPATGKYQVAKNTIHPFEKALDYARFKVFPNELGEEQLCPFVPEAAKVNQEEDNRLQILANVLSETLTTHAVATAVMENEPWDFMAVYYTGIDHFSHAFMQYHPPRLPFIGEAEFELYKDVVAGAYRFHDMMLERLLHLAGEGTTVILCSDHGFESGELRPFNLPREPAGPAASHRRFGIFVANGPGIKQDERVTGASLIDIAPTILTLAGLPVGADMDGRALVEIFETTPAIQTIPSWDEVPGECGHRLEATESTPDESEELLRQFVALGYVDDPGEDRAEQHASAVVESAYNLARNLQWLKRYDDAIDKLAAIVRSTPWESRFIDQLADCCREGGRPAEAIRILEAAYDMPNCARPAVRLIWALAKLQMGEWEAAAPVLAALEQLPLQSPGIMVHVGNAYLRQRRWAQAEAAYRKVIERQPENSEAHVGLSTVLLARDANREAAEEALTALGFVYRLPQAHFNLGLALTRVGENERAVTALETALKFGPRMAKAHRLLAFLQRVRLGNRNKAELHAAEVRRLNVRGKTEPAPPRLELGPFMPEAERERILVEKRPSPTNPRKPSGKTFVLVSGLPRSGTSLAMQMLERGGLEPKTDGQRAADIDNPKGYYEWEDIKKIGQKPRLLDEPGLDKKAIKCVSMLLRKLPYNHRYKVIFMMRPVDEIVASQAAMIDRLQSEGARMDPEQIARGLEAHRAEVLAWLKEHKRIETLVVDYPELVADPTQAINALASFLGPELLPNPEAMRSAVDRSLHRKKAPAGV